eukprot:CAMPEP_0174324930 /NCGR_PEP_ID=MMETSP0810-20121108/12854_1 /TAXON_ID=73025 ORGANISM="Eutreptiella gymnastica-like, Strain CCMP1594" /NCGR_SAMPLE_ID=MMETSP0810 /ASSEMBLY_ACC=CAM_ASM_000659 /LENGTH=113 /DNA_ID=CAMNT_0015437959 /DNA_START=261 /DNA_END=602 /DNA_ORIENTATION=-
MVGNTNLCQEESTNRSVMAPNITHLAVPEECWGARDSEGTTSGTRVCVSLMNTCPASTLSTVKCRTRVVLRGPWTPVSGLFLGNVCKASLNAHCLAVESGLFISPVLFLATIV